METAGGSGITLHRTASEFASTQRETRGQGALIQVKPSKEKVTAQQFNGGLYASTTRPLRPDGKPFSFPLSLFLSFKQ